MAKRRSFWAVALGIGLAATFGAVAVGCGGDSAEATTVDVELGNWYVRSSLASAPEGKVTFRAIHVEEDHAHGSGNEGGTIHELAVARKLPDGSFDILGSAMDIEVGETKSLTLELKAGEYELQCNVGEEVGGKPLSHYREGMHSPFTVG